MVEEEEEEGGRLYLLSKTHENARGECKSGICGVLLRAFESIRALSNTIGTSHPIGWRVLGVQGSRNVFEK